MAVLVIIGAVSIPAIKPMLTSNHLQAASDMVRSRWTEMRTRAVADGRSYRFSIVENTGKFRIAPEDEDQDNSDAAVDRGGHAAGQRDIRDGPCHIRGRQRQPGQ